MKRNDGGWSTFASSFWVINQFVCYFSFVLLKSLDDQGSPFEGEQESHYHLDITTYSYYSYSVHGWEAALNSNIDGL